MSLINEALRKARQEAHRRQAASRGEVLPKLGRIEKPARRPRRLPAAGIVALAALLLAAALIYRVLDGRQSQPPSASARFPAALPEVPLPAATEDERASGEEPPAEAGPAASAQSETGGRSGQAESRTAATAAPRPARSREREPSVATATPSEVPATATSQRSSTREASPLRAPNRNRSAREAEVAPAETRGADDRPMNSTVEAARVAAAAATTAQSERSVEDGADSPAAPESAALVSVDSRVGGSDRSVEPGNGLGGEATKRDLGSFIREADLGPLGVFSLDGIAWSSERPFALVNGQVVGRGGFVNGAAVTAIEPASVTLRISDRELVLRLR